MIITAACSLAKIKSPVIKFRDLREFKFIKGWDNIYAHMAGFIHIFL